MEEIFRLCDRVSVLRDGRHIATESIAETSPERIVRQMVGREVEDFVPQHVQSPAGETVLRVEGLSSPAKYQGINLQVHAGEIVGLAGLVGAGRSEIASAIFGLDAAACGKVLVAGREIQMGDVREALAAGIGFLPEDRKRLGLVLSMDCRENGSLAILPRLTRGGLVDRVRERELIDALCQRMKVKAPNLEVLVASLSGGNQQKVALAKWLALEGRVLIVDEPTRGVDVVAKAEIHTMLDELAARGMAILLISSELPELMKLSRRILVIRAGELVGEVARTEFSEPHLMRLMAGVAQQAA
jgi:ABC-type sugar transport system ATPase subunit